MQDPWAEPAEHPVLVLGSGQRTGSTLVQRLLCSHPDVLVWGEHGGHLRELLAMHDILGRWDAGLAGPAREAYRTAGHHGWIANLLPGPDALHEAARAYLLALFHAPAGRPRWGFKEVRFGFGEAAALRSLFGGLVAVHVTRDPRDVLVSLIDWERHDWWPREYTEAALRDWVAVNESFQAAPAQPWVLSRRYEDIVADPQRFTAELAALLRTEPSQFDASVFERRVRGYADEDAPAVGFGELPADARALLDAPALRRAARRAGY